MLGNENVHLAFFNALAACGGGTVLAVVIGLAFSWIVVRTNTPFKRFIAGASMIPLFVPPLVAGVAWSILGSPKTGLLNTVFKWIGIDFRFDFYSMSGLIVVFGIYYAPYVYMFTASALRNMDPSLEEASEVSGASAFATLFTVTFPLIAPAILAGSLLSFVVMLGIYGVPAALGAPANINVLTTYIFKLTAWSPPLYNTAAAVAILLMIVTAILVWAQQRVLTGKSFATVAGKAFRPARLNLGPWRWFTFGLAVVYLFVVVVLPTLALIIAAFRKFLFIKDFDALFDMKAYGSSHFNAVFDNPLTMLSIWNTLKVGVITALIGGVLAFAIGYTVNRTQVPGRRGDRPPVDHPGRHSRPGHRRRLSVGLDRPAGRALRHDLDPGAGLRRPLHPRHGEGAVDLVHADPQGARGSRLDLRPRHAQHHRHHRAAAGAARRRRLDDAAVRAGGARARLVALPLHQRHDRDGRAAARLLRGRQHRQDRRLQPGADGDPRRAARASPTGSRAAPPRAAPGSADRQKQREETHEAQNAYWPASPAPPRAGPCPQRRRTSSARRS